ncbi:11292_t:CDS:1 [Dentiscutata erythropus]|uniref:11292_t:CDS:1 n=1 Tax=Dentiscutata erythropus TaxID=1348616 RepID=A0A9N8V4Q3_9GLOM|nr:11292_t:CDS:1 [Dentiscutata erythropus]
MAETPFLSLFFLIYFISAVSARLQISDMSFFEIREYIPYIVVTIILLILIILTHKCDAYWLNKVIFYILLIFLCLIFPPIFFYATEGFSKATIALISVSSAGIVSLIIGLFIRQISHPELIRHKTWFDTPPLNSPLHSGQLLSLQTIDSIFVGVGSMIIFGIFAYLIVIFFMSGFDIKIYVPFIVILLLFLLLICLVICYQFNEAVYYRIVIVLATILGGIGYYILFYSILKEVNRISLLLFWADLWLILLSTYTIVLIKSGSVIPSIFEIKGHNEIPRPFVSHFKCIIRV